MNELVKIRGRPMGATMALVWRTLRAAKRNMLSHPVQEAYDQNEESPMAHSYAVVVAHSSNPD